MKQQSQVNPGDIHPKVLQVVRLERKRRVKKMVLELLQKDRRRMGK
jgi:hypothetical protein